MQTREAPCAQQIETVSITGHRSSRAVTRERGISDTTLWRWARRGWITLVNISGKNYVDLTSLAEFDRRASAGEFAKVPAGAAGASCKKRSAATMREAVV
jgi:hypothetical protein